MYAQLTALQLRPNRMGEVLQLYEQGIIPLVQQQQGCRFVTLLTSPTSDQVLAIYWWESEADLLAGQNNQCYQQQLDQIDAILLTSPVCTTYQVSLQVAPI